MFPRRFGWRRFTLRRFTLRRALVIAIVTVIVAFCTISARLFVFPAMGMPARVDAIVVLGGTGNRLDLGMRLASEDRAPYLVLSLGLPWVPPGICRGGHAGHARVICFRPSPDTTQGEAEGASRIARRRGWRSMVVVTTRDQVWRARLRFARCYSGRLYGLGAPVAWDEWPYAIAYQWLGTIKAEIAQRGC
jgi:uncharacterized SAM-binding protein YcdF (DUF218 family)